VYSAGAGESEKLNVGNMKELSGGDRSNAEPLYGSPIEFEAPVQHGDDP
jgi:hypothetical protein